MNKPMLDAERIAAMLDGRLDERQRAEVMAQLASSEEAFDAFVDAAAVTPELTLQGSRASVRGARPRGRTIGWRRPGGRWLALAAVLAGIAVLPWSWSRLRPADADSGEQLAVVLADAGAGLPTGWDGQPWSTLRGSSDGLARQARAVRLGARLVDLELAARAGDHAMTGAIAIDVATLAEGLPAGGVVGAVHRDIARRAGEPASRLAPTIAHGRVAAAKLAGEELVTLGAWLEAARIAAARRNADFFRADHGRALLARSASDAGLGEPARQALHQVSEAVPAGGEPEWGALEGALTNALRVLGS